MLYGFSESDAKRIGKAVRLVERDEPRQRFSGPDAAVGSRGVRLMIGTFGTAAWDKASSATVTIYSGDPGSSGRPTATASTVVAFNIFADIATGSTARWAAVSNNGFGWYLIAAECS